MGWRPLACSLSLSSAIPSSPRGLSFALVSVGFAVFQDICCFHCSCSSLIYIHIYIFSCVQVYVGSCCMLYTNRKKKKDAFPPHLQESISECGRCSLSPFCQFEVRKYITLLKVSF